MFGAAFCEIKGLNGEAAIGGDGFGLVGPGGAHGDPFFEIGDNGLGEFAFGRHFEIGIAVADGFDQQAGVGVTGLDGGADIAALQQGLE